MAKIIIENETAVFAIYFCIYFSLFIAVCGVCVMIYILYDNKRNRYDIFKNGRFIGANYPHY